MRYYVSWKNYRLLQERQPEIGGALSCQRMLAFLLPADKHLNTFITARSELRKVMFLAPSVCGGFVCV